MHILLSRWLIHFQVNRGDGEDGGQVVSTVDGSSPGRDKLIFQPPSAGLSIYIERKKVKDSCW